MRIFAIFFICVSLAFGLATPKKSKFDSRINHINYNKNDVTLIKASVGYVTMLSFDENERSINIATGFSDGWEILAKENYIFIKPKTYAVNQNEQELTAQNGRKIKLNAFIQPKQDDWKTNLIITTNKRVYNFDLMLVDHNESLNYQITFAYPSDEKAKQMEAKKAEQSAKKAEQQKELEEAQKAKIQTELDRVTIPRNYDFTMHINKNSENIAPNFAYDDGVFTYLGFDNTKTIPSIFFYDEQNGESIANTHIEKNGNYDVVVIHQTITQILLRSGNKLVGVKNGSFAKNPLDKTYTTKSKKIIRKVK